MYTDFVPNFPCEDLQKRVLDRLRDEQKKVMTKNDTLSANFLKLGKQKMDAHKWRAAAELLNLGVSVAENGSDSLPLFYKMRSKCFNQRHMSDKAKIDQNLSIEASQNQANKSTEQAQGLKLPFIPNEKFPNLASALEVRQNAAFGRHVVSARAILKIKCKKTSASYLLTL